MNEFINDASNWLWDCYLLATALLAAVLFATRVIRQPAQRLAIHWATGLGLLLLALLCAVPDWSMLHMTSAPPPEIAAWTEHLEPVTGPAIQIAELPRTFEPTPPPAEPSPAETLTSVTTPAERILVIDYGVIASYVIGCGALVSLLWLALGAWQVRRLRSQAAPAPEQVNQLLSELTATTSTRPAIGISDRLTVAVAVGLRRPMVLLPSELAEHSGPYDLKTVLAHELAHIRNRDLWLLAIVRSLLPLLWIHPLYWLWRRGLRLDQETLADAAASEQTSQADYADQLVTWARSAAGMQTPRFASSVGLWESPSQLKRRVAILLDEKLTVLRNCSRRWRWGSAVALTCIAICLSLVTLQPESAAVEDSTPVDPIAQQTSPQHSEEGRVKLIAIGTHGQDSPEWWDAQGKPLESVPFTWDRMNPNDVSGGGISDSANSLVRRFVIKVDDLPEDGRVSWWRQPGILGSAGGLISIAGQRDPHGYKAQAIAMRNGQQSISLRLRIAAGSWKTMHKLTDSGYYGNGKGVTLFAPEGSSSEAYISISHNYSDQDYRLFAVDKLGNEHIQSGWGGRSSNGIVTATARFPRLPAEEVDHYLFKVRDYEWVELKDLPLHPAKGTSGPKQNPLASINESSADATASAETSEDAVAELRELVDSYVETFKKIEALHKTGSAGGEKHKLLLAKYYLQSANARWLEATRDFELARKQYASAVEVAEEYVSAVEAVYDSGRVPLKELLDSKQLLSGAKRALRQAKQRTVSLSSNAQPGPSQGTELDRPGNSLFPTAQPDTSAAPTQQTVWTPPAEPDPVAIRREATEDARRGDFEVALAKRLWYHNNALAIQPSQSGVRLSFALSEWLRLGEVYPPALAKMREIRDSLEMKIRNPQAVRVRFEDFQEFASFNETLRDHHRTVMLFRWINDRDPEDAKRLFRVARRSIIQMRANQLYGKYLEVDKEVAYIARSYRQLRKNASDDSRLESMASYADEKFINNVSTLVAILMQLGRPKDAESAAKQSRQVVADNPEMLEKLERAIEKAMKGKYDLSSTKAVTDGGDVIEVEVHEGAPAMFAPVQKPEPIEADTKPINKIDSPKAASESPWIVHGKVTDAEGNGLAGVEVRAATGVGSLRGGAKTETDSEGHYRLAFGPGMMIMDSEFAPRGVGVQAASIFVSKSGWSEANLGRQGNLLMTDLTAETLGDRAKKWGNRTAADVVFPDQPKQLNFVMQPAVILEGVLKETREDFPNEEQTIWITGPELPPSSSVLASLKTDEVGKFSYDRLPTNRDWKFSLRVPDQGMELESETFRIRKPGRYLCQLEFQPAQPDSDSAELKLIAKLIPQQ